MSDLGVLAAVAARKRAEADALRCAAASLWAKAESLPAAASLEVLRGGTVIAELKRRSPSGGELRTSLDCAQIATGYAHAGAAAVSVLTDGPGFGGSLQDLAAVRAAVGIAVLRKDFVVDPVQVAEARVAGADWVLLIAALLDATRLGDCLSAAHRAGAGALVEVHDSEEARCAVDAGARCIGVNNRDLRTLRTDLATFAAVRSALPSEVVTVAESGVRTPADCARLVSEGADAVLVGEALMRAAAPEAACRDLVAAARAAAAT